MSTAELESVKMMRLQPGDTIVVESGVHLTADQAAKLRSQAEEQFPGYHVVVLTGGATLSVVHPEP